VKGGASARPPNAPTNTQLQDLLNRISDHKIIFLLDNGHSG